MLTFAEQQKILTPILAKTTNKHCADCHSSSPTWASLDFGVFVCSNCSGAHRALGPTVTRIKSVKLDQWRQAWLDNMHLGNEQINQYWESSRDTANIRRPNGNSAPKEYERFVEDKYLKRKFVGDKTAMDPLTCYKNGISVPMTKVESSPIILQEESSSSIIPNNIGKNNYIDLLDDSDFVIARHQPIKQENKIKQEIYSTKSQDEEDQFDDYVEAIEPTPVNNTHQTSKYMNFDDLIKNSNQYQPQQQNHHTPFNPVYNHPQMQYHQQNRQLPHTQHFPLNFNQNNNHMHSHSQPHFMTNSSHSQNFNFTNFTLNN